MFKPFSDIIIIIGIEEFHLNKIILAKIPYFAQLLNITDEIVDSSQETMFDRDTGKKIDVLRLTCDIQSFKFIINQIYENNSVIVKLYDKELFETLERFNMRNAIDKFVDDIVVGKISMTDEKIFIYMIQQPKVREYMAGKLYSNPTTNPLILFHNLTIRSNSMLEIYKKKDEPFVKKALDLFYRKEIKTFLKETIEEGKTSSILARYLILYDEPIPTAEIILAINGIKIEKEVKTKMIDRDLSRTIEKRKIELKDSSAKKKKAE